MNRILSLGDRWVAGTASFATAIASILCLLMAVHIVADVCLRAFLNMPLPGTVAIVSNYYMVGVTFLPLALVERQGAHIAVEIVSERFSHRFQYHLQAVVWLLCLLMAALLTRATWAEASAKTRIMAYVMESGYRLHLWPAYYFLPIGLGLLTIVYGLRLAGYLTDRPLGGKAAVEPPVKQAEQNL